MEYKEYGGLRFREPNNFEYELFLTYYQNEDNYSGNEIIIKNTLHKEDKNKINDDNIIEFFIYVPEICNFKDIKLTDNYIGKKHLEEYKKLKEDNDVIYSLQYEKEVGFFRNLTRQELRQAYNLRTQSLYKAWKYITQTCFLGGDTILITNDNLFASSVVMANTFIFKRNETLKKN